MYLPVLIVSQWLYCEGEVSSPKWQKHLLLTSSGIHSCRCHHLHLLRFMSSPQHNGKEWNLICGLHTLKQQHVFPGTMSLLLWARNKQWTVLLVTSFDWRNSSVGSNIQKINISHPCCVGDILKPETASACLDPCRGNWENMLVFFTVNLMDWFLVISRIWFDIQRVQPRKGALLRCSPLIAHPGLKATAGRIEKRVDLV